MKDNLPPEIIGIIQNHTGFPWWNGEAYADYHGFPGRIRKYEQGIGEAIDDLSDVINWLREENLYAQADRLRTIAGRLANLPPKPVDKSEHNLIRNVARGWK